MFLKDQSFHHKSYRDIGWLYFQCHLAYHPRIFLSAAWSKTFSFSGNSISYEDFCTQEAGKYKMFLTTFLGKSLLYKSLIFFLDLSDRCVFTFLVAVLLGTFRNASSKIHHSSFQQQNHFKVKSIPKSTRA